MKSLSISAQETLYLSSALATVFGHAGGYLRIEWNTVPMVSTDVRQLFQQILRLLRQEQLHKVFTERTTAPPLSGNDCEWMASEWIPQAAREAGLTHCAVVESQEEVASRANRLSNRNGCDRRLHFRFFDSFAQAETWIREAA